MPSAFFYCLPYAAVIKPDAPQPKIDNGRSVYLETFGCQMNELDSELVRGHLSALGYKFTSDQQAADVVLYNTCSVRQQAENKVLSRLGIVAVNKREGAEVIVGVIGCMAEREGADMIKRYPQVDLMCGPGELDKLPMLIDNAMKTQAVELADRVALQGNRTRRTATLAAAEDNLQLLDLSRAFDPDGGGEGGLGRSAYVRITRGCNKYCTYCVVPYTRGAEVHRPPGDIVDECKRLADSGVIEITLLGQTVNHYVYTHGAAVSVDGRELAQVGPGAAAFKTNSNGASKANKTTSFAELLRRIHDEVPLVKRLRFVTSYPRDFGDDILHAMADCERICEYLHAPLQSGSDRVLKLMNRGYTSGEYLDFVDRARAIMPDVSLAGDIIVGFSGETDEDFQLTKDLLKRVRFKNNFIFKYSPRPGTTAIERFKDDVPEAVKRQRNNDLLALQAEISAEVHRELVGRHVDVFVEKISPHELKQSNGIDPQVQLGWESSRIQLSGRTEGDLITVFDAKDEKEANEMIGRIVRVKVTASGPLILQGVLHEALLTEKSTN